MSGDLSYKGRVAAVLPVWENRLNILWKLYVPE